MQVVGLGKKASLRKRYTDEWNAWRNGSTSFTPEEGESFIDLTNRVFHVINTLLEHLTAGDVQNIVMVTQRDVIRVVLSSLLQKTLSQMEGNAKRRQRARRAGCRLPRVPIANDVEECIAR